MKDVRPSNVASRDLTQMIDVFRQAAFAALLEDIKIYAAPGPEAHTQERHAILSFDESGDLELRFMPAGFTKLELLDLRDQLQHLDEGAEVTIGASTHIIALFSSTMTVEDHEVQDMRLTFQIDPFA